MSADVVVGLAACLRRLIIDTESGSCIGARLI